MTMRKFSTCFSAITVMLIFFLQHHLVASLSPIHQKTALFHFNQSLTISGRTTCFFESDYGETYGIPSYAKTKNWSMSSDHCRWEGVSCDHKTGDVIGLDLSCSGLEGAILPNSTLFQLSHLRFLNLSNNNFSRSSHFPQEFGSFAKGLTHLNLSNTRFSGRVPSGISHLYKLVSLDLSDYYYGAVELENEDFKSVLQNLTQLRVLNLHSVNISSVLPPVNLSTSLRVLDLRYTGLYGVLPQEVFHLPNIEVLALGGIIYYDYYYEYEGPGLQAVLPKVKWGSSGSLQYLFLSYINFNGGGIPDSIGFVESLVNFRLRSCNLSGPIPRSIGNLGQLTYLGLLGNNLNGQIPTLLTNLTKLRYLDISYNNFTGLLPTGLFNHPSLEEIYVNNNGFTGQLYDFDSSKLQLQVFDCTNNSLYGPIPQSFSQLVNLTELDLSSNNFNGVLDMEMFSGLEHLETLSLSHNSLSVRSTNTATLPSTLTALRLSSCNMKEFPHFSRDADISLSYVDLSNNEINGEIPHWIGSVYYYLNISHNRLTGGLERLPRNNIQYLDLQSNKLSGSLPTLICNSSFLEILNLSHNNLSGVLPICRTTLTSLSVFDLRMNKIQGNIPATLSNFRNLETLNLNGNRLEGRIPSSFAELDSLRALDLGNNHIKDTFPQCLEALPNLQVLILKSNKLYGLVNKSSKIEHPFPMLRIIDLSNNEFSGPLPATYFQNFKAMMTGDVNERKATYMEHDLGAAFYRDSAPATIVIKGVEIELVRILTVFKTIDLSRNNFDGKIPEITENLVSLQYLNLSHNYLRGHIPTSIGKLSMLDTLDLSFNQLNGSLRSLICNLSSLGILNLSHNNLSGELPICPSNLTHFLVFDLRMNNIQGNLPSTLSNFRNLVSLNLHGNKLEGRIPSSFSEFEKLETLDLGSNQISDTFPLCLEALQSLQVLVLKSNKFHGLINKWHKTKHPFPSLRIIDLSYNEFSGPLPTIYFRNFKAMMNGDVNKIKLSYMGNSYYSDTTSLVIKGVEIEFVRILNVFTTIDVSWNNFEGKIDDSIGNLVSLRYLNISHNKITGHIPSLIGKLSMLESLDLSFNQFEGEIPPQLTGLYSLARLNLSCNQLSGHIPLGSQFNTFNNDSYVGNLGLCGDNDSYVGNLGLCGFPLSKACEHDIKTPHEGEGDDYFFSGFTWEAVVIGYGCGVVPAFIIGNLMLLAGKPKWFAGIIARELGLKIRRMEIKWR